MKKITYFSLVSLFSILLSFGQEAKQKTVFGRQPSHVSPEGIIRCASTEYEHYLQQNDPKRMTDEQFEAWLAPLIEHYKSMQSVSSESGGVITIPVVVHVIHSGQAVGTAPNIADGQVESQITVMNQDFRRMAGTPGFNNSAVGADTMIQFALAKVDPNGNPTNGIDRQNLCQPSWSTADINATVKPTTIWDPTQYMNMWSVQFSDGSLLGYAQFPNASGLQGLNASGGAANTDGVVANYSYFGSRTLFPTGLYGDTTYDKGRTMTHEVGHFLGLRHIWGDSNCGTDYCADTPTAHSANFGCPTVANCNNNGNEMVQNYMDYTDDSCMNIFTVNQKDRFTVIMNNAPRRVTLKTSTKDLPIPLFANDAELKLENVCSTSGSSSCTSGSGPTIKMTIYNRGTSNLTSAVISYNIDSGTSYNYNWSGNLAANKFATFDMPITNGTTGVFTATVTTANGVTDQRATNNEVTTYYEVPAGPTNYTFNNYVFRLQRDQYGSETTWNLKNQAGTILYSGNATANTSGLPALFTQNWTLASGGCYTFTINDSYGDGICCTYGNGFYDIKSTDGATIVASGGSFSSTESKVFTVNSLGNDTFESLNDVYVFPNPTRDLLNITAPSGIELIKNVTVYNYLGQVIVQKNIVSADDLTIDTSNYSSGVYLITVSNGSESKTLRFIRE